MTNGRNHLSQKSAQCQDGNIIYPFLQQERIARSWKVARNHKQNLGESLYNGICSAAFPIYVFPAFWYNEWLKDKSCGKAIRRTNWELLGCLLEATIFKDLLNISSKEIYRCLQQRDQDWKKGWGFIAAMMLFTIFCWDVFWHCP